MPDLWRTILLCPNRGVGREILRARALQEGGWAGLEVATPESLAIDLVAVDLAIEGRALIDDLDRRAAIDAALDEALPEDGGSRLAELREGVGFRDAVANAIDALRLAGVGPGALRAARLEDAAKRDALARILQVYEADLAGRGLVDAADVFRLAIAKLEAGADPVPGGRVELMPHLGMRGLSGRFVRLLADGQGRVRTWSEPAGLPKPPALGVWAGTRAAHPPRLAYLHAVSEAPPAGPEDPAIEIFAAGSTADELREALRRAIAAGRCWDEVEIVAIDPIVYGCALDALATRLGIPVTYAVGLPIERTQAGRAAMAYLTWLQEDFPAAILRQLLETGDLRPSGDDMPWGDRLARRLRRLRVGWGRNRYADTIERALARLDDAEPGPEGEDGRTAEEITAACDREREELETLRDLITTVLAATPAVPDRLGRGPGRLSPAALARGLLAFLELVPHRMPVEAEAHGRLSERLERIAARLTRETTFGSALTILRAHLDLRVPSPGALGPLPWSSGGGALHLSDLDHGGWTGRPLTFVVGLDAERFPGAGIQEPILLDDDRRRLDPAGFPSSSDRLSEARWSLTALLARLRGTVTLSYSAWSASEGREVAPTADLLQALRLREDDAELDYGAFHAAIAPVACAVPRGDGRLDSSDVWLGALSDPDEAILLAGLPAVRRAFPRLDRGLVARAARESPEFTRFDGRIEPRPDILDPRRSGVPISSSTLETLGGCPLRYYYRKVLHVVKPDDPELDPGAWLEARHRGSLLHDVFEITLERARDRAMGYDDDRFPEVALAALDEQVDRYRGKVPAPSEVVYQDEVARLQADVRSFVGMIRERAPEWIDVEREFGYGHDPEPVTLEVTGGPVRVRGRIDRVDREGGALVVVDYKSGSTYAFSARFGIWRGGRHLQHLVYSRVARLLYGRDVKRVEYWFPTVKGENHRAPYETTALTDGDRALEALCETIARGWFVPTDHGDDCKFCDYQKACRVQAGQWNNMESPPADWGKEHGPALDEYEPLRTLRGLT